jgi:hypothetical protein
MTTRTRYFLLGSAAILLVGLCTGLVAYYGGFPTGAFTRTAGPEELTYIPADAAVVAYANVRDVMASEFRQRMRDILPDQGKGQREFQEHTGINIETDVDHVVAALVSGAANKSMDGGALVLVRGRFDAARLQALAVEHKGVVGEYNGKRLVTPPSDGGDKEPVLAFLENGLVAVGDGVSVRRAIDTAAGGANVTTNDEIMDLMDDAVREGNAWAVGRFDALTSHANLPQDLATRLPAITAFSAAGRLDGGVSGTLRAVTRDPESAENLRQVIQGFVALARMQAGSRPEFQALTQALQLAVDGSTVALSFSLPPELFEALAALSQGRKPGPEPEVK